MKTAREWWSEFTKTAQERDAEALREESQNSGADAIEDVVSGQLTTLTGTVQSLIYRPETNTPMFEAELFDGSGTISLLWLGRRKISGITPGINLAVTGRLVRRERRLTMFNPSYRVIPKGSSEL